ncbi:putative glycolipid-binding domain-containing protein [Microbacterium resistens]|uniref:putative glycolipid-binding domain-containing protein n=1 Tax=Microbacterium resistens TaxID=156977 RepID=UPI001C563356|nr:putative glycolipid-binding domain-containing protein [Microbacterium resistens]MBW1638791.1 putative glycolipid-binding domain-containing protein [Microbacterium resistens]
MSDGDRYQWQGIDDPDRTDLAHVRFSGDAMRAHGTSITRAYATSWSLDVGPGWITRSLEVDAHGAGWRRSLRLTRDADGAWSTEADARGEADLAPPGLADPEAVRGAVDCDLGLCPLTNTMPIRRLGLLHRSAEDAPLVMAWVEVPSLRVIRSEQLYGSFGDGRIRYASANRDFAAELTADRDAVVLDYPQLARRVAPR